MINNCVGTPQASTFGVGEKKPPAATSSKKKSPTNFANDHFILEKNRNLILQNDKIELELKYIAKQKELKLKLLQEKIDFYHP